MLRLPAVVLACLTQSAERIALAVDATSFTRNVLVDLNYIGSNGSHLCVVDGNAPNPAIVAQLLAAGTNPAVLVGGNLWFGNFSPSPVGNNAFYQAALNRSIANSNYSGFQATVTKRFSRGFQIQTAYTWSHAIDDGADPLDAAAGDRSFPQKLVQPRRRTG